MGEGGNRRFSRGGLGLLALGFLLPRALGPEVRVIAFPAARDPSRVARLALAADEHAEDGLVCKRNFTHLENTLSSNSLKASICAD